MRINHIVMRSMCTVIALGACASPAVTPRFGAVPMHRGAPSGDSRRHPESPVILVVSNDCAGPIFAYVLNAAGVATRLGVVPAGSARSFDVSAYAPVGASVLFGAGNGVAAPTVFSEPVTVESGGSIAIRIAPARRALSNALCRPAADGDASRHSVAMSAT